MNRNSAKQKLKDLRTKLANLDFEIRSLISKAEMEPGLIDAIVADISGFTQEIVNINSKINKLTSQGIDESISLLGLFKEGAKDKKSPEEVNQLAISIAKNMDIPDYVLNDEKLFAQFMNTLKNGIQPKKLGEAKEIDSSVYEKFGLDQIENSLKDPDFAKEGMKFLNKAIEHAEAPEVAYVYKDLSDEEMKEYIDALKSLKAKYSNISETSTTGGEGYMTKFAFKKKK
jgi:hypothetical protein